MIFFHGLNNDKKNLDVSFVIYITNYHSMFTGISTIILLESTIRNISDCSMIKDLICDLFVVK